MRLLMGAADLSLEEIIRAVHRLEGLVIAAHIDRPSFSVIANLGMVPSGAQFDTLEISASLTRDGAVGRFPFIEGLPLVTASDAHVPLEIGSGHSLFLLERMDLGEMRMAIYEEDKRLPKRKSYENPFIDKIDKEFLKEPPGETSHRLPHTMYTKRAV
ncbi:MAG: iron hydrogenase small subunit [Syntrophales bacterium]